MYKSRTEYSYELMCVAQRQLLSDKIIYNSKQTLFKIRCNLNQRVFVQNYKRQIYHEKDQINSKWHREAQRKAIKESYTST